LQIQKNTDFIKAKALELGFMQCNIAQAKELTTDAKHLENWLKNNLHGSMQYMENYFDKRIDPRKLVDNAQSVITLLFNYYPQEKQNLDRPKISKYAFGTDYHYVLKEKLNFLLATIQSELGNITGRGFVDSAPVLERAWARESGLGWVGKNGNIISPKLGSFFFISTLIVDIPLVYDNPFATDHCGTCTACIDNCPTQAILPNKVIDGSKCISYYTIELKDAIINSDNNFDNWFFGCDVCQDVCPWNKFSKPHNEIKFKPIPEILNLTANQWNELSEEAFRTIFKNSPLKRAKFSGIKRNLKFISNQ
jgi:epoxyqueuosine reductase